MKSFKELPPIMVERARWAREQILGKIERFDIEIDEDELLAWVFNKEDGLWYSVDGNYSKQSPSEKMCKRRLYSDRMKKKADEYDETNLKRLKEWEYWDTIRQEVLERDNNTCEICGKRLKRLDIHHILPRRIGGSDNKDNSITLCHKCYMQNEYKGE